MKTYKLTLICTVALFATGCSSEADEGQNKPKSRMEMNAEEESISEAEIENAFAVFEDMATTVAPYQDNIVYSPLSKDLCLGMVANALVDGDRDRIVGKWVPRQQLRSTNSTRIVCIISRTTPKKQRYSSPTQFGQIVSG